MAGPGDQIAAGAGGYSYRRTSHVDRERVIDILEAAFVQRRLARDEFDLRVWAAGHDAAGQRLVTRLWNPTGMSSLLVLRGRRRRRGGGRGATRVVAGCGEPAAEHGGEAVGVFDVGQVPAIGEHRQPAVGQAQCQYPVGPGEGRDHPPPAGSALLVPVQQEQQRSGAGFQILGFHPVDRDPAIMKNGLPPRAWGCDGADVGSPKAVIGVSGYSLTRVSG